MPGEQVLLAGRYRVVRQLGRGGMGSVWLAEDTALDNHPVAVKMLPAVLVADRRAFRQLKDEALVSMRLVHPNVVQVRSFEENGGNPFLVSDYVDGRTLDDVLAERGRLPEEEALRLLAPVAAALDYAHRAGVVHRDVKPANVMVRRDGTPFVLDFGIAREVQETLTRVTGRLSSGTLLYMSPEQLRGAEARPAQDVYSFAATAYECLSGSPPFTRGQVEFQILNEPPPPLVPEAPLARAVLRGLAKRPEDRPPTCAGVLSPAPPPASDRTQSPPPTHTHTFNRPAEALETVLLVQPGPAESADRLYPDRVGALRDPLVAESAVGGHTVIRRPLIHHRVRPSHARQGGPREDGRGNGHRLHQGRSARCGTPAALRTCRCREETGGRRFPEGCLRTGHRGLQDR